MRFGLGSGLGIVVIAVFFSMERSRRKRLLKAAFSRVVAIHRRLDELGSEFREDVEDVIAEVLATNDHAK